jgi:hypothetical protein
VPINTRFKGAEAGLRPRQSRAKLLFTVTDFLDTDYVTMLDAAGEQLACARADHRAQRVTFPDGAIARSTSWPAVSRCRRPTRWHASGP